MQKLVDKKLRILDLWVYLVTDFALIENPVQITPVRDFCSVYWRDYVS